MPYTPSERHELLELAWRSIETGLAQGSPQEPEIADHSPALREIRSSFVTLHKAGKLRGCIGGLEARWPLAIDVSRHAHAAAFHDPRFPRLSARERETLTLDISVLGPPEPMAFQSDDELIALLVTEEDGLIIQTGVSQATFLPTVWQTLPDPYEFLRHLKLKAGIPRSEAVQRAWRYRTESITEPETSSI